jgi:transposase
MTLPVLGIDIAKLKFNVCLINSQGKLKHRVFINTLTGFEQLLDWLSKQGVQRVHACLEATGTYGEALSLFLHEAGHRVSWSIQRPSKRSLKADSHAPKQIAWMPN